MSTIAAGRAEIVAALNAVAGIQAYLSKPSAPRSGDAWLTWRADRDSDTVGGFDITWSIVIVTPAGEQASDTWIDDHLDAVLAALRPVTYVTGFAPANLGTDASPVFGLLITTDRE